MSRWQMIVGADYSLSTGVVEFFMGLGRDEGRAPR
jgi:hypothetical protein